MLAYPFYFLIESEEEIHEQPGPRKGATGNSNP
jgi:hypothetical protein